MQNTLCEVSYPNNISNKPSGYRPQASLTRDGSLIILIYNDVSMFVSSVWTTMQRPAKLVSVMRPSERCFLIACIIRLI